MRSPGDGELSLSACPGVGNRLPSENKIANPRGYARGDGNRVELNHAKKIQALFEDRPFQENANISIKQQ